MSRVNQAKTFLKKAKTDFCKMHWLNANTDMYTHVDVEKVNNGNSGNIVGDRGYGVAFSAFHSVYYASMLTLENPHSTQKYNVFMYVMRVCRYKIKPLHKMPSEKRRGFLCTHNFKFLSRISLDIQQVDLSKMCT